MSFIINSYRYAVAAAPAADVTPDALSPSYNATNNYFLDEHFNAYFKITGISSSITLKISYGSFSVYYKVISTDPVLAEETQNPTGGGWTLIPNNGTLSVSNNQWVVFGGDCGSGIGEWSADILNNSSSDALLTTINFIAQYIP